jgi:site-specific recombinase XerD
VRTGPSRLTEAYAANGLTGKLATHTLRNTFANNVYRQTGRDIVKLKHILGHAHIATTAAYLSFDQADLDAAVLSA